jgi:FixH
VKTTLIALLLLAPAAFAADQAGAFDANTAYEAPAAHAPAHVSRMFARSLTRTGSLDLPAAGDSGMIIWTISAGRPVTPRVTTPKGATMRRFHIDSSESAELGLPVGAREVVHVARTVAANYRVDVEVPEDAAGVTVVAAEPDSAIALSTWAAPLSRQPHQPITLHAELRHGGEAISGATVTARLASPGGKAFDSIALADKGNGVYEATLAELPANVPGAWQVRFEAEGATANGVSFARTGFGELVAERGAARLRNVSAEVVGENLRVTAPALVHIEGNYRFDVIVAANGQSLAWAEGARQLDRGPEILSIDVPMALIGDTPVGDLFLDVRLLGLDTIGVADRVTLELN